MKASYVLTAGGALVAATAIIGYHRASVVEKQVAGAVSGASDEIKARINDPGTSPESVRAAVEAAAPPAPDEVRAAAAAGDVDAVKGSSWYTGRVQLRLTGYWPFSAVESEKKMEGGKKDRKGRPLHTVQDFFAGKSDHVSLSGDDAAWPYGQKVTFQWLDGRTVVGRVTDTGRNFRGSTKVYRAAGNEPIDICVATKRTKIPTFVTGTIVSGDTLDKSGRDVDVTKFRGQDVVVGCEASGIDVFCGVENVS